MKTKLILPFLFVLLTFYASGKSYQTKRKPNIIIIIGDDATYNDLPLYGGINVKTPAIDKLAAEGLTFNRAYLCEAMCAPCRNELYTGLFPMRNGDCWNHCQIRPNIKTIVQYMDELGYRVGIAGKIHVKPKSVYSWDLVEGLQRNCSVPGATYNPAGILSYMKKNENQPFCLIVALVVPHVPWTEGDTSHFKQSELKLPLYLADTKETRSDYSKYLAEIEILDQHVSKTLAALKETGQEENTIVIFTSEQGSSFPGCKYTNYNTGVHTAFIVRWPGIVKPGKRTNAIIQYADVLPTLIESAGGRVDQSQFDGKSFLPVLKGKTNIHRKFAYFIHNNIPEGPPYPIRAITDGRYQYIRNLSPNDIYIEKHVMGTMKYHEFWPSWLYQSTYSTQVYTATKRFLVRPDEQLFNIETDPNSIVNQIDNPLLNNVKIKLIKQLDEWLELQGDPGKLLDTWRVYNSCKNGNHEVLNIKNLN